MTSRTRNRRDNFLSTVVKTLCFRAGGKCCKCGTITIGPNADNPQHALNIGRGAHIAAAAPGGPRYDAEMRPEDRSSITNGLWLCCNCHDIVDKQPDAFTTAILHQMKRDHEQRVRKEVGKISRQKCDSTQSDMIVMSISSATILDVRKTKFHFLDSQSRRVSPTQQAWAALGKLGYIDVEEDEYSKEVGWELLVLFQQLVSRCKDPGLNLEVIRRMRSIVMRFYNVMNKGKVQLVCDMVNIIVNDVSLSKGRSVYKSAMTLLKDFTVCLKNGTEGLHNLPRQLMREMSCKEETDAGHVAQSLRSSVDEPDGGLVDEEPHIVPDGGPLIATDGGPETKNRRQGAEVDVQGVESQYVRLMDELCETNDKNKILAIEQKMEDLGFTVH